MVKVYTESDILQLTRVGPKILLKTFLGQLTLAMAEVLQGGRDLEISSTPKRAVAVGSDNRWF